ncbi:hypothetical protein [Streptomyces sp. NPDC005773]|uniref:AMP-binding enzyme n=1 Tax=Streptomyces sp. NPDC005773 TaxID=3364727 RepID=UPI0036A81337
MDQAVVIVRDERLLAYTTGHTPDTGALRDHLANTLPAYMIPSAFTHLDTLPLTTNGKLDRTSLPPPPPPPPPRARAPPPPPPPAAGYGYGSCLPGSRERLPPADTAGVRCC